jgi:hypothetical protein
VAELASAFIGAHIGLPADHHEDHAAYPHNVETGRAYNPFPKVSLFSPK